MLIERVSRMLGLLDEQFVRNGGKSYAELDSFPRRAEPLRLLRSGRATQSGAIASTE